MNILHITEDFSLDSGGLRTVINDLSNNLNNLQNINSYILSSQQEKGDNIELVSDAKGKPWLYSVQWNKKLVDLILKKNINILHIHGVWMYPQYKAAKFALKHNIPFILSPHGMYEPWLWTKGRLKKSAYFNLLVKSLFSKASRIHAITSAEKNNLKPLFPQSDFVEIPNLISFELSNCINDSTEKYLLYVGRLHEKKGIKLLISSFSKLKVNDLILKIAGEFNDYKIELVKLIEKLDLQKKVQFLGLVTGEEKMKLFKDAYVFVAPSYSEVVGMVNLEAASQKTPVITTHQTGLKREWNVNGGILINPNQKELTSALEEAASWSKEQRDINGERLYNFVKQNYSWEHRLQDWVSIYSDIIKEK
ncbi:glycosyltransferase [Psychroflexus sediminis]|uniref:Glycosyltransferase involved in cell wall bisynthesis n=1 Tax=Psychroflexus sediminis TaxID=470826 RepID=A0A1G7UJP9_9FLAO|nr:glycosyltransferase [Psychroflexus sediminis]SDG47568.1 Glycosyltransferase involved in cell wall bisynthesis [Psychroflexus sediminis]